MSEAAADFLAFSSWALTAARCVFAAVWASVRPFFAASKSALGGWGALPGPFLPFGLIRYFCALVSLQSHSRRSVLLVKELRSRHLPVVRLLRTEGARTSAFQDWPLVL